MDSGPRCDGIGVKAMGKCSGELHHIGDGMWYCAKHVGWLRATAMFLDLTEGGKR